MKVLIIIDWYYPAYRAGGPITSVFNFVNALKEHFEFYILTSNKDYGDIILDVQSDRWIELEQNHKVFYASSFRTFYLQLKNIAFDIIIINGIYSFKYSIFPTIFFRKYKKFVFPRGMLSVHALSVKTIRKKIFVFFAKIFGLYKNTCFVVNSKLEQKELLNIFPSNKIFLLKNFVSPPKSLKFIDKNIGILKLVTIGRVSPVKNYEFAIEAIKNVPAERIIWDIFGAIETMEYFEKLNKKIALLPNYIEVNFKGNVSPDKLNSIIAKYHFFYLPTKGENFGHAIYEAWAAGRPVIISNTTPWRDLLVKNVGWDLPLNIDSFRNVLSYAVKMSYSDFEQMCSAAFNYAIEIAKKFNDTQSAKKILTLCTTNTT